MVPTVRRAGVAMVQVLLGIATAIAGCASTEMTHTWTDPNAKGKSLQKVAVIVMAKDPGLRRMGEDTAVTQLAGAQAVPSYQVLADTDLRNMDAVKAKLAEQGFQGALVMRLAGVTEQVSPVTYGTFDGYYGWAAGSVYGPAYLETDTIVHVISTLYALPDGKLIWSGASKTFDPTSARQVVGDVSHAVAKELQKDRLIL